MEDQNFKNQYVLKRMIVWLIDPLELNPIDNSIPQKKWYQKKNSVSQPKKGRYRAYLPPVEKYALTWDRNPYHNQEMPAWIFMTIPLFGSRIKNGIQYRLLNPF